MHISEDNQYSLITDPAAIAAIAADIARTGAMVFDLEFSSEDRFIPELSLMQVAWGDDPGSPNIALIDCVPGPPTPLFELIGREDISVVIHSARQDLGLLAVRYGVRARSLWDSQIAAAFVGIGEHVSYAKLIDELCGVSLDKSAQFTAWLERPLSSRQLAYAVADVRYLPAAWAELKKRLEARGRLDWVREESERLAASTVPLGPPEEAYRDVKCARGLTAKALGSLRALAGWRQRQALAENKPLSWIVPDPAMVELCRAGAKSERALRAVRGVGEGTVRRYGAAIMDQIAQGARTPVPETVLPARPALSQRGQILAAVVVALVQARCLEEDIAPRFVATRSDAEALVTWFESGAAGEPEIELMRGWRRTLAGDLVLAWLRGERALIATSAPAGLAVVELEDGR